MGRPQRQRAQLSRGHGPARGAAPNGGAHPTPPEVDALWAKVLLEGQRHVTVLPLASPELRPREWQSDHWLLLRRHQPRAQARCPPRRSPTAGGHSEASAQDSSCGPPAHRAHRLRGLHQRRCNMVSGGVHRRGGRDRRGHQGLQWPKSQGYPGRGILRGYGGSLPTAARRRQQRQRDTRRRRHPTPTTPTTTLLTFVLMFFLRLCSPRGRCNALQCPDTHLCKFHGIHVIFAPTNALPNQGFSAGDTHVYRTTSLFVPVGVCCCGSRNFESRGEGLTHFELYDAAQIESVHHGAIAACGGGGSGRVARSVARVGAPSDDGWDGCKDGVRSPTWLEIRRHGVHTCVWDLHGAWRSGSQEDDGGRHVPLREWDQAFHVDGSDGARC
eukprot:m.197972 g.197972  ORF g.197972 m.197972 type:complete len:385 (-) comp25111_c0_seq1:1167-2321(-)